MIIGGCGDGTVRVWDAGTGQARHVLDGHMRARHFPDRRTGLVGSVVVGPGAGR